MSRLITLEMKMAGEAEELLGRTKQGRSTLHGKLYMRNSKSKISGEMPVEGKEQFPRTDPTVNHRKGDGRFRLGLSDPLSKCTECHLRGFEKVDYGCGWPGLESQLHVGAQL